MRGARRADHPRRAGREPAERRPRAGLRVALQRRPQGHRLLRQRPGRRASRRVLLRPHLAQHRARGGRTGRRGTRRDRARGPPRAGGGVVERPGGQPRRVRHRALRKRVHRPGPAVAARLRGPAARWPAPGRLRPAGPRRAPAALGHPGRAGLRIGHRAHAGTDARRRGGRGPGRAGAGLPRGPPPHPRGVRGAARPGAGAGACARARHSAAHEGSRGHPRRPRERVARERRAALVAQPGSRAPGLRPALRAARVSC